MARLFWVKVWTEEWLDGSVREQLTPTERSIFIDLLAMAGRSRKPGFIQSNVEVPYSHEYLANRFKVSLDDLERALGLFVDQGRINENSNGIEILNWRKYQDPKKKLGGEDGK